MCVQLFLVQMVGLTIDHVEEVKTYNLVQAHTYDFNEILTAFAPHIQAEMCLVLKSCL